MVLSINPEHTPGFRQGSQGTISTGEYGGSGPPGKPGAGLPTGFAVPVLETGSPGPGTGFAVPALETGKAGAPAAVEWVDLTGNVLS